MRNPLPAFTLIGLIGFCGCSSDGSSQTSDSVEPTVTAPTTAADPAPQRDRLAIGRPTQRDDEPAPTLMELTTADDPPTPPVNVPTMTESRLGERWFDADNPIDVVVRPGTDDVVVVERLGTVRAVVAGELSEPLLDLRDSVQPGYEWGLLGLAFSNDGNRAYINETDGFETRIHEFPVAIDGTFDEASGRVVYRFDQPADGHNGGDLLVGPDGFLYIFNGDGGGDRDDDEIGGAWNSDIYRQALTLDSPLGKILRIDPSPSATAPFTIPPDNPFVNVDGALGEIWATGLRSPWRNGFDPVTGDLWIADVGNFEWEEISRAAADSDGLNAGRGLSFGWSAWEGFHRANDDQSADGHLVPVHEYFHGELGCSVVGGPVYRGSLFPDLDGHYLFGDHCSGFVWAMEVGDDGTIGGIRTIATLPFLVDIAVTPDGGIVVTSIVDGVHRLEP